MCKAMDARVRDFLDPKRRGVHSLTRGSAESKRLSKRRMSPAAAANAESRGAAGLCEDLSAALLPHVIPLPTPSFIH